MSLKGKLAYQMDVFQTTDYGQFKTLLGNRHLRKQHATALAKKMVMYGNFTQDDPVEVSPTGDILDGQHRLEACKINKFPVFYVVKEHAANVEGVRARNTGRINWNWYDVMVSYADMNEPAYKQLLQLTEETEIRSLELLTQYAGFNVKHKRKVFMEGGFKIADYDFMRILLNQLIELANAANINRSSHEFSSAAYRFMRRPDYDHQRLVQAIFERGAKLSYCYLASDYYITLNEIYQEV